MVADKLGQPRDFAITSDHRNFLRIEAAQGVVGVSTLGAGVHPWATASGWRARIKKNKQARRPRRPQAAACGQSSSSPGG
jgi:hypothetical protein